jgi:DNA-binding NtrC family response regulator
LEEAFNKYRKSHKSKIKEMEALEGTVDKVEITEYKKILEGSFTSKPEKIRKIPTILIEGGTGTGKTLVAKQIAKLILGKGIDESFCKIPLVNLSKELVDTELFGVIPGQFTGASLQMGRFLSNAGGIVFLDEIGDTPLIVQTKLLTYFDDMVIQVSGRSSKKPVYVPLIIIAATNRNLKKEIIKKRFREDLYHRFIYKIRVPDLSERKDDFRFLLSFALQKIAEIEGNKIKKISVKAIEKLERYQYPGNFRELESIISNCVSKAELEGREIILAEDIDF